MKAILLMISVLSLVSCGKKCTKVTEIIENKFDDSKINAYELIQDARLDALEIRAQDLEKLVGLESVELITLKNEVTRNYNSTNLFLNNLQSQVSSNKVTVVKICSSNENMIKMNDNFYAVYMVSNNYGTYLGKLLPNLNYQTTDSIHASFHITNGSIICN